MKIVQSAPRLNELLYFFRGNGLNYCPNTSVINTFYHLTLKLN
jgi:hypothetical protein